MIGTILTVLASFYAVKLYKNLRTDFEELLPTTARSVIDLNQVTSRLESTENLGVLIFSKHKEKSKKFVIDLAEKLQKAPKDIIASIDYRIDRELEFFNKRKPLFMKMNDLEQIKNYIHNRIEYEKELYNPFNLFSTTELPEPKLDLKAMEAKYNKRVASFSRFPDGFYANPDETIRVLLVDLPGKLSGIESAKRLRKMVDDAIAELNPTSYAPDLEVKFTGGVQNVIEEQASLLADLELSTIVVLVLVTLVLYIYYRSIRVTLLLVVSLLMGTVWAFGLSYYLVGYLNANTAFLGAIIIGNGINFGIIYLARYLEERRAGRGNSRAIYIATRKTMTATITAALAAGLAYGSLVLTSFRGFNQFGVIGFVGMMFCWISAFTILPALLVLAEKISPLMHGKQREPTRYIANTFAWMINRFPGVIWGTSFILTILALIILARYDRQFLESDLSKLRDKKSMTSGSAYLSRYLDEVFQRYLSPVVILPKDRDHADEIASRLKHIQEQQGEKSFISGVYSLDDFLPKNQYEKIKLIKSIKHSLPDQIFQKLEPADRNKVTSFLTPESFIPITENDLPPLIKTRFTEKDGSMGKMVLIEPPITTELWDGDNLLKFIHLLRNTADEVSPGAPVAGSLPVTSDMFEAIKRDGPRATAFAFFAVIVLVIFLFRNLETIFLVLFGLLLGVAWFGGIVLGFDLKINFLNFIALPITFGIGIDYGVNVFQRYRMEGKDSILSTIRNTGGAVGLASMTTIIGYSSLLIAGNQAFVSFGRLAVLGEITCVFAALLSLPAFLCYRAEKKKRREELKQRRRQMEPVRLKKIIIKLNQWVQGWPAWWNGLSKQQKYLPAVLIVFYWLILLLLKGFQPDHLKIGLIVLVLSYGGKPARTLLKFLLPLILTAIIYDSQRFYSDYIRGAVHVVEPYYFDLKYFGIKTLNKVLTPNEWLQLHLHPALDFATGLAYLLFIPVFVTIAAYWRFWSSRAGTIKRSAQEMANMTPRVMWAFFWVNIIGYSMYYWYPAAPPWYVSLYGLVPADLNTPANQAGCIRFDQLLGTHFFTQFYGKSADVFGAIPSLHVAYPLQTVYYAFRFGSMRLFSVCFFLLMCFSAVYLNHHYVLDLIWGSAYALIVCAVVDLVWNKKGKSQVWKS